MFSYFIFFTAIAQISAVVKIGCIGDSITQGHCSWNGYTYPRYMQIKMGANYTVSNFGVSGKTMLNNTPDSYWATSSWPAAQAFQADIYTVMLGTNDAKAGYWLPCAAPYLDTCTWYNDANFSADLLSMVAILKAQPQKPKVYLLSPPPVYSSGWGINQTVVNKILPVFDAALASATEGGVPVPVFEALGGANLTHPEWTCDGVHPNDGGYEEIGNVVSWWILKGEREERAPFLHSGHGGEAFQFLLNTSP